MPNVTALAPKTRSHPSETGGAAGEPGPDTTGAQIRERSEALFRRMQMLSPGSPRHRTLRNEIVELNLNLAAVVCNRYRRRPDLREDLRQVAVVGLIKAVDGYRPGRGNGFLAYAMPTISGEVKRYFRDHTWQLHVRRGEQELFLAVVKARDELGAALGRDPSDQDIAERLGISEEQVRKGIALGDAHRITSLDRTLRPDAPDTAHAVHGGEDPALELTENLVALRPLIAQLPARDRQILALRFCDDMTQSEIGEVVGLSQMHVSRLLTRTCARLRDGLMAG
ncbi:sigma-70 family RNA polymerase sigma factor [Yinghuangia soli]|uniref:Sigma-70 family RNA polymerase sigma factor n=1 Tax=Yinghuangia soli TaxID=2908204 RepID=A0AA41PXX9_9ACTN|nr:sigma-70 family RNA polymerase sigma factor [Yinghuangia soli]MCF2527959.1 sigma-70 family RNA polymerase sigma factor [Yinghuangia soli]